MKKWIKICLTILTFAIISVCLYFILKALGFTDINKIKTAIKLTGGFAILTYIIICAGLMATLCFVPLLNESLMALGLVLFSPLTAFISCLFATLLSNTILFFIGDKFGERLAVKLVGKEELEKTQNLIDKKSKLLLPILFLLPGVPDEALCLVAGITKMRYSYLILISAVFHIIEIGLICFLGCGIINWATLTILDWIIFINIVCIDIYFLFKLEKFIK